MTLWSNQLKSALLALYSQGLPSADVLIQVPIRVAMSSVPVLRERDHIQYKGCQTRPIDLQLPFLEEVLQARHRGSGVLSDELSKRQDSQGVGPAGGRQGQGVGQGQGQGFGPGEGESEGFGPP